MTFEDVKAAALDGVSLIFQPTVFYRRERRALQAKGGVLKPLLFGLGAQALASSMHVKLLRLLADGLSGTLRDIVQITLSIIFASPDPLYQRYNHSASEAYDFLFGFWSMAVGMAGSMSQLVLLTLVTHVSILALLRPKGGPLRWHTTFKIMCYSQFPWVLALIPWAGSILAFFLTLSTATQGLAEVYGFSTRRVVLALAFPFLVFGVFFVVVAFLALFFALNLAHLVF